MGRGGGSCVHLYGDFPLLFHRLGRLDVYVARYSVGANSF